MKYSDIHFMSLVPFKSKYEISHLELGCPVSCSNAVKKIASF